MAIGSSETDWVLETRSTGDAGMKFIDPCLKVAFADGAPDVVLRLDRNLARPDVQD